MVFVVASSCCIHCFQRSIDHLKDDQQSDIIADMKWWGVTARNLALWNNLNTSTHPLHVGGCLASVSWSLDLKLRYKGMSYGPSWWLCLQYVWTSKYVIFCIFVIFRATVPSLARDVPYNYCTTNEETVKNTQSFPGFLNQNLHVQCNAGVSYGAC